MKKTNVFTVVFAVAALSVLAFSSADDLDSGASSGDEKTALYDWLRSEYVRPPGTILVMPDVAAVANSKIQDEPRYKVGITVPLNATVNLDTVAPRLSSKPVAVALGAMRFHGDGFVWSAVVHSPDAASLRLEIEGLVLPDGVELYLYNDYGQVDGPYTGTGRPGHHAFFTRTLAGDRLYMQLRYRGTDTVSVLDAINLTLSSVANLDERFLRGRAPASRGGHEHCSNLNESCVQNAECDMHDPAVDPVVENLRNASAHILFQSGGGWYICTGALIESLDGTSGHFLTANHCISTAAEAASLETYFHFTTPCPVGGGPTTSCDYADAGNSDTPASFGATIIDTSQETDFTLMMLDSSPPVGTVHLPFSTIPVANSNGVDLYRISYPSGAPQAFSQHEVDADWTLCGPPGNFIYSSDVIGATEGGSSGSAVVNSNGEIVGQLYGACGTNTGNECDTENNRTYDGAFSATWQNRPLVRNALAQEPLPQPVVLATYELPGAETGQEWRSSFSNDGSYDNLTFTLNGPDGDGDLYVKLSSPPTTSDWDCRPYVAGTNETCTFDPAATGEYHVMVRAASAFADATLTITTELTNCSDGDSDGVCDAFDNCVLVDNPSQCDTNGDGYGNHCDADLDNNGIVNSFDLTIMRENFGALGANDADLDCNEIVNSFDLTILREYFGGMPGQDTPDNREK